MTDLKQEIRNLEGKSFKEKFEGIVKVAYPRKELIDLLSGDEKYIFDTNGNLWLAPEDYWGPVDDDLNIAAATNAVNDIYKESHDENLKNILVNALTEMLNGTPVQFYYAVCVFCHLASLEDSGVLYFSDWVNDYSFVNDMHPIVSNTVKLRKNELVKVKIKNIGQTNNLYIWCRNKSNSIVNDGFAPFVED